MMSIKDRSLLEQAARGNKTAVRQIWEIWSPRITVYLRNTPGLNTEDREDLAQEIMLKVYRGLDRYNPVYAPATWIYTIASRTVGDWRRKHSRAPVLTVGNREEPEDPDFWQTLPGPYEDPETACLNGEDQDRVRQFIRRQKPGDRQLLFLVCYEGLSGRAAARVLEMPHETVRYRMKILKRKLKEAME